MYLFKPREQGKTNVNIKPAQNRLRNIFTYKSVILSIMFMDENYFKHHN